MRLSPAALRDRGPLACQAALCAVVVIACAVTVAVARLVSGEWGPVAACVAALTCWCGAASALGATMRLDRGDKRLVGMLVGMALRMGIPLTMVLILHLVGGPLVQAGLLYYFLLFYPLTLAVETALSLPVAKSPHASAGEGHRTSPRPSAGEGQGVRA